MDPPEVTPAAVRYLPCQAPPLLRCIVTTAIGDYAGVDACDNDHNTDTEHDLFFVDMS